MLLCVGAAAVSVFAIYLPDRAADQTRTAVNAQGPKIVTEMLTYDPKSLKQDFERARSLTTDKYRPELVKQQESVQKGHPVINEYWVTDSTVLSAARDSATMLLFMQGHRGGGDDGTVHHRHRSGFARERQRRALACRQPGRRDETQTGAGQSADSTQRAGPPDATPPKGQK